MTASRVWSILLVFWVSLGFNLFGYIFFFANSHMGGLVLLKCNSNSRSCNDSFQSVLVFWVSLGFNLFGYNLFFCEQSNSIQFSVLRLCLDSVGSTILEITGRG
jgi:hypothetical protein